MGRSAIWRGMGPGCDDYIAALKEAVKADGVDPQSLNSQEWTGLMCAAMPSQKGPGDLEVVNIRRMRSRRSANVVRSLRLPGENLGRSEGKRELRQCRRVHCPEYRRQQVL